MKCLKGIKKIFHFDDTDNLNNQLLTIILTCIILGSIIGIIPMLFGNTKGWWLNLLMMVLAIIAQIINVHFKKHNLATSFLSVSGIFFALPVMYFRQGGIASGMPFWFVFCILTVFIMLEGWRRYVTVIVALIIFSLCFGAEYHFPDTVDRLPNTTTIFTDILVGFVSTTAIYLIMLGAYLRAFKRKGEKLDYALHYDALTGIENRYSYENYMKELNRTKYPENLVLVSADVNNLKVVNDTLGHTAGDELLKGAAYVFSQTFGEYGKVFRTGGDEFQAAVFIDKSISEINQCFENNMKNWSGELVKSLHISVGYACGKDFIGANYEELIKAADQEMYKNKAKYYEQQGINRRQKL